MRRFGSDVVVAYVSIATDNDAGCGYLAAEVVCHIYLILLKELKPLLEGVSNDLYVGQELRKFIHP